MQDIISSLVTLRKKCVIDLEISFNDSTDCEKPKVAWDIIKNIDNLRTWYKEVEMYAYLITDYY